MISIIVVVYNTEKYIKRCIDSILSQTYKDFELIVVDDGSTDCSGKICDEYALKDPRVRVIHQQNGGVSSARKVGIENAIGEYTIHADSDDWMENNYIESLYNIAKKNDADMVICDYWFDDKDGTKYYPQIYKSTTPEDILKEILCTNKTCPTLWSILIRSSCYLKYDITFSPKDIIHGEDTLFICRTLLHIQKIVFLKKAFYHYNTQNTNSITSRISDNNFYSRKCMIKEFEKDFDQKKYNFFYKHKKEYLLSAFLTRKFSLLSDFPDINEILIKEGQPFRFSFPQSSCLALALQGHPLIAFYLFKIISTSYMFYKKIKISL